ncbi:MAG: 23S rRNA (guanosine(2251)-2'-O)-methyltransferase RlmB [Acidimicrobiia bacterium]
MSGRSAGRGRPGAPRGRRGSGRSDRRGAPSEPERGSTRDEGLGGDVVEGRNAVFELLRAGKRRVREVLISDSARDSEVLDEIADMAAERGIPCRIIAAEALRARAHSESPQGVIARAASVVEADVDALLEAPGAFIVALDGVTDPGNLGAVLRSACAAGATGVVLPRHRSARLSPTAMKAAAGAVEYLPIARIGSVPQFLERATRAEVWSVGLDADGDVSVFDLPIADQRLVLVLGAEGRGLARLTRERCEILACIPMAGATESLNVSAAAAVACFEILRRRA